MVILLCSFSVLELLLKGNWICLFAVQCWLFMFKRKHWVFFSGLIVCFSIIQARVWELRMDQIKCVDRVWLKPCCDLRIFPHAQTYQSLFCQHCPACSPHVTAQETINAETWKKTTVALILIPDVTLVFLLACSCTGPYRIAINGDNKTIVTSHCETFLSRQCCLS